MSELAQFLNQLQKRYHQTSYLSSDPLEFVHRYKDPWDQETIALLSAVLAYGNVKQIRKSITEAVSRMQKVAPTPKLFVEGLARPKSLELAQKSFQGYVHRFNLGEDLVYLFQLLALSWKRYGSLGAHFVHYLDPEARHIGDALNQTLGDWKQWLVTLPGYNPKNKSFSYLLTSPKDGSACKRWCMFLRWMGRKDEMDLGLWTKESGLAGTFPQGRSLRSDQLIIPLDTHTGRISQYLRLTERKSLNWLAAVEVTEALKDCDPKDPTRYDFSISRLGILDLCQRRFRVEICSNCELIRVCRHAEKRMGKVRGNTAR